MSLYDQIQSRKAGKSLADQIEERKSAKAKESESKSPGIMSYLKEPLISTLNLGQTIGKYTNPLEYIWPQPNIDWRKETGGVPEEERNWGHAAAGFLPELAASLLAPEVAVPAKLAKGAAAVKGGKYALKAAQQAIPQAAVAAAFNPDDPYQSAEAAGATTVPFSIFSQMLAKGNPYLRGAAKLGLAGGAGYAAHNIAKDVSGTEWIASPASALAALAASKPSLHSFARKVQKNRLNPELEQKLMGAGEKLGIDVGAHEANPHYSMGKIVGGLGKTPEGAERAFEIGEQKVAQQSKAINKLLNDVYHSDLEPKTKKLYETAYKKDIPSKVMRPYAQNEVIKDAINNVENKSVYKEQFKNIGSKDNVAYWDLVKRALDDSIQKEVDITGKISNEGRLLTQQRDKLVTKLDKVAPEYQQARALAQRKIVRNNLEHVFNKKEFTAAAFSDFLKNKKEVRNLMKGLKNVPEAREQVEAMSVLFKHLQSPQRNAKAGSALESINVNKPRSDPQFFIEKINEAIGGKLDKAAVELMSNPKWKEELDKLSKVTDREKLGAKMVDLFGRASSQGVAKSILINPNNEHE